MAQISRLNHGVFRLENQQATETQPLVRYSLLAHKELVNPLFVFGIVYFCGAATTAVIVIRNYTAFYIAVRIYPHTKTESDRRGSSRQLLGIHLKLARTFKEVVIKITK